MTLRILGMMTGTSCDGLDAACVEFKPGSPSRLLWSEALPYPRALRERVLTIQAKPAKSTLKEFVTLERDLGIYYANSAKKLLRPRRGKNSSARSARIDVIANHGQTLAHHPDLHITLQAGNPSWIVRETQLTVVSDFRSADLAAGGEGAPFAPRFHAEWLRRQHTKKAPPRFAAVQNLGGISNISWFKKGKLQFAFDTGTANLWIDEAVSRLTRGKMLYDANGAIAKRASQNRPLSRSDVEALSQLLRHPFHRLKPPKSTGRDDFPFRLLTQVAQVSRHRGEDLVSLATLYTVESIAHAYERDLLPSVPSSLRVPVYLCGGGAQNKFLVESLSRRLPQLEFTTAEDAQSMEAQAFAYFGYRALLGKPIGGHWTGVNAEIPGGRISPGKNWTHVAKAILSLSQINAR